MDITADDLQMIIKSACKCERLIFNNCNIHCSKTLDFSTDEEYNLNHISFESCGRNDVAERNTDWKTSPTVFENIVEAISKCDLKIKLKTVDIHNNQSLDKTTVQQLFNNYGISHISAIQKGENINTA